MIHLYKNNPTAGGTDGSMVSEGTNGNPITIGPLDASKNQESAPIKLAIRCDNGYVAKDGAQITATIGESFNVSDLWDFSLDGVNWVGYKSVLRIEQEINNTNTVFYCRAKAIESEQPSNDITAKIIVITTVEVV